MIHHLRTWIMYIYTLFRSPLVSDFMPFVLSILPVVFLSCIQDTVKGLECGLGTHEADGECLRVERKSDSSIMEQYEAEGLSNASDCSDGADNDLDGHVDCEDQDCYEHATCDSDGD